MLDDGQLVRGQAGVRHRLQAQLGALVQQEVDQRLVAVLDRNVQRREAGFAFLNA